jgi:hypothetical protein
VKVPKYREGEPWLGAKAMNVDFSLTTRRQREHDRSGGLGGSTGGGEVGGASK